jgi:hypothetical protein
MDRTHMRAIAAKVRVGRVCRQIRRCLIAHNGRPVLINDLLDYCYAGSREHPHWHYRNVHRALPRYAICLGRFGCGSGRSGIYAPRPELARLIRAT